MNSILEELNSICVLAKMLGYRMKIHVDAEDCFNFSFHYDDIFFRVKYLKLKGELTVGIDNLNEYEQPLFYFNHWKIDKQKEMINKIKRILSGEEKI